MRTILTAISVVLAMLVMGCEIFDHRGPGRFAPFRFALGVWAECGLYWVNVLRLGSEQGRRKS